jgi:glycine/D-amino acid oxidase-like deaminating enzyme
VQIDIFSPNAISGVVTEDVASCLTASAIVGAANVPFLNERARSIAASRGIKFVPEFITSAGAIIVDSLEWCHDEFTSLRPSVAYAFVYDQVYEKVGAYLKAYDEAPEEERHRFEEITRSVCEPSDTTKVGSKLREWLASSTEKVDVVVVGAGMAGTAAAYQLSKQAPELKGVVLEAGDEPAHRKGSSFGASRMFRQMYSDPYFSDLQSKSLGLWKELEEESGSKLLDVNGLLFYGEADTGETVEGSIPGAREVMEKRGLPHEYLDSPEALQQRFPGLHPEKDQYIGLFEQTAGSVNSSLACKEMMRMAEAGDWRLQCNAGVKDVWQVPGSSAYHVLTADGKRFVTDKLVVAAGAWTNNVLAHLNVQLDVDVWRVHWGHYKLKEGKQSPQWFHFGKGDALYYGFPGEDGIAKVGVDFSPEHDQGLSMDCFQHDADEELSAKIDAFVQSQWGDVYGERVDMVASPYTMSKDAMFVLDTLPGHPNVSIFSAGNGRAFKFGPMLGKALAALVTGTPPPFDIAPMSLRREGICKSTDTAAATTTAETATVEDGSDSFGRAHVPYGERGEATYSKLTMGCFDVVQNTADLVQSAVQNLQLPADHVGSVRLADFGSADGGPEMPLMHQVKSWLPAQCDLEVAFEDQPNNDFQSLFALANGLVPLPLEGARPLVDTPGIFFSGIGRSFFEQCLPRDSVDLCTSFTAMHWLSQFPTALPDSAHHTQSSATPQLALFEKQAASDWRTIMGHRATELRKGGQGVVASFGVSPEGRYLGWSGEQGSANMYAELNTCWDAMLAEGRITAAEHKEATFCNYYRTEAELRAPFEDDSLGLQLLSLEWRTVTCPFGRGKGTPEDLVGTVRTWSNSTFLSALSDERSPLERSLLVDHLYDSYAQRIAAAPADHHMDYQHAYLHFVKV